MYKVGDIMVCIDDKPYSKEIFYDYSSCILEYHKINPLEKYKYYTIKEIHTYWGDDGNCGDKIDNTSSTYENTSYILDEVEKIHGHTVFDMKRFIGVKEYRTLKLNKINEKNK